MNKIETIVYNIVRKNPAVKQAVRNIYQGAFDILPKKKDFSVNQIIGKEGYFFGFHDVSPFSHDEKKLLANKINFDLRMPKKGEELVVGYFDFNDGEIGDFHQFGVSKAWNYHKGCRLQWLDDRRAIYNTAIDDTLRAVIVNADTKEETILSWAIDAVHGKMATSFSYERLERCMPGYGYPYSDGGEINEVAPDSTGLYLIDIEANTRSLLLSIKEIATQVTGEIEMQYLHFVTHSEFSKDGRYISFLYRRIPKDGDYMKRRSVMCVYDLIEKKLIVLPSQESGSHYVWNKKNQIIASCILDGNSCHALFDMNNLETVSKIDETLLNSDGHQSFVTDNTFVTDTYPDKWRMAKLYLTDINSNSSKLIASLYSPKKFQTKDFKCHIACDLHPRVSPSGKYVCFDSPRSGHRGIYVMKIF